MPGKAKQTFEVEFRRLTQSELTEMGDKIEVGQISDADVCREVVIGWNGVQNDAGDIVFSPSALDDVLDIFPLASNISAVFFASLSGARRKN